MKEYTISKIPDPCILTKEDLEQLILLIQTNFDNVHLTADSLEIRASHGGVVISENQLNSFLNHLETPKILFDISITMNGWNHQSNVYKSVSLSLHKTYSDLSVRSYDQTWTIGKCFQIMDYLKSKRIFFWFLKSPVHIMLAGAAGALGIVSSYILIYYWARKGFDAVPFYIPLVAITSSTFFFLLDKFKHTQIILKSEPSFIDKYNSTFSLLVAFLGLLATIIFGVLAVYNK